jgi:hypothetical protein
MDNNYEKRKDFSDLSNQALAYLLRGYIRCNGCDGCPCEHIICILGPNSHDNAEKEFLFEIVKRLED